MSRLSDWLDTRLSELNWKPADLARASRLPDATISRVLNGSKPAPTTCSKIARALNEPPEKIMRLAGQLPPLISQNDDVSYEKLGDLFKRLAPERREDVLRYTEWRYQQQLLSEQRAGYDTDEGKKQTGQSAKDKLKPDNG